MKTVETLKRRSVEALTLVALATIGASTVMAQYPTRAPAAMPLRPVRFPPFVNGRLANGVSTLVVAQHDQPVITISLAMPAGSFYVPEGKEGLADIVATLLTKGTERRTADQLAAEIEGAGGTIGATADDDFLTINVSGLSQNVEQLFDILGDVVQHSTFPATEVDLARTQALSGLQAALAQPEVLADRAFNREIYGTHPYGRLETPETLRSLTRDDVAAFVAARVRPAGALLVVAGDITPARASQLAASALGGWRGAAGGTVVAPSLPARARTEILLVHKPGAVQSNIVAGFPFITPRDPSVYALTVANLILGGGSDARLFMILREQKGWTYGAYSQFSRPRGVGAFQATAEVRTPVTDSALAEMVHQLQRMRTEAPSDSEITNAKNYRIGRFPLDIETADQIAGRVATARLLGLPDDYVLRYRERLAAVTKTQIATASRRYFTTDRMIIVVVGDGTKVLAGLKAIAPVRIVSTEGAPMTEADLAPRTASRVAYNTAGLRAGTAQYRVLVQGNPLGTERRTYTRVQDGGRDAWQVITATELGSFIQQYDTTTVDAASLAPIRVRQGGRQQGQETFVRIDYAGGRVRGNARTLSREGPATLTIDTTVAPGVVDDNELPVIAVAMPWAAGARFTLDVFSAGKNQVQQATASVVGEESVTTPAGTFACWKIDFQGAEQSVTFYIAKDNPVIVKLELQGAPVAFELTQRN